MAHCTDERTLVAETALQDTLAAAKQHGYMGAA